MTKETHTGVMVALYPRRALAREVALPGGEPVEEIHLTLTFHGKVHELQAPEKLVAAVAGWAARTPVLDGEISGVGLFTAGPMPVTYLSADVPGLPLARAELVAALVRAGHAPSMKHGYTPHITLAYADRIREAEGHGGKPLRFASATAVLGTERVEIPLQGVAKAADSPIKAATPKAGLETDPGPNDNWVERTSAGRLPAYVEHVALAIHRKRGVPKSTAIAIAIGTIKRWAAGGGNVDGGTRAAAAKAVAEWEAMKAEARAS